MAKTTTSKGTTTTTRRSGDESTTGKPDVTMTETSQTGPMRTCADVCNETLAYCWGARDEIDGDLLACLIDCAEICTLTANVAARGSRWADNLRELCADACKECEEMCEEYSDDEMLVACADACRECWEHLSA